LTLVLECEVAVSERFWRPLGLQSVNVSGVLPPTPLDERFWRSTTELPPVFDGCVICYRRLLDLVSFSLGNSHGHKIQTC